MHDPYSPRRIALLIAAGLLLLAIALALGLGDGVQVAALRNAAGGEGGGGGFGRFVTFINRLADYVIPVGAAFSVLGLVWGGMLFMRGDSRAGSVLGGVAIGVAVVLLSKPLAA